MSNASNFASFLEKIGHQVRYSNRLYAYNKHPAAWLAFPFHETHQNDAATLLSDNSCIISLRYCETQLGPGSEGHRIACQDKHYSLETLSSKARNQTRRGLENCTVEQVTPSFLRKSGFELFNSTRARQNRPLNANAQKKWVSYCDAAESVNGFSAWAAWANGHLAAFTIGFDINNCFNILRHASHSDYLHYYPNNALVFSVTQAVLSTTNISDISYGLSPISTQVTNLDNFKRGMGYTALPIKQNVVVAARFNRFVPMANRLLGKIHKLSPSNEHLSQAHAMLSIAASNRLKSSYN